MSNYVQFTDSELRVTENVKIFFSSHFPLNQKTQEEETFLAIINRRAPRVADASQSQIKEK